MPNLLALVTLLALPKNMISTLTTGLQHHEFQCKCSLKTCHKTLVSPKLLTAYASVRTKLDFALKINSGYRCQVHNNNVGGTHNSKHTTGHAIDISTDELSDYERIELNHLMNKYFDYVKVYDTFIHGQINE